MSAAVDLRHASTSARRRWGRALLPVLAAAALMAAALALWAHLTPDRYDLRLVVPAGGTHETLARVLARHALARGVTLELIPVSGGPSPQELLAIGQADLCFVSGAPEPFPAVTEVLLLAHETLHILARAEVTAGAASDISAALCGRRVNLGPLDADWRGAAEACLAFSGLKADVDFERTSYALDELRLLPAAERPDVVVTVGCVSPPEVAELIGAYGYRPLELPYLAALTRVEHQFRLTDLPPAIYSAVPPVPMENIAALEIDLRLVARAAASPRAIQALLSAVFDGAFARDAGLPWLDEQRLGQDRRMRLHAGAVAYQHRHDPWLTPELVDETEDLRNFLGALGFGLFLLWRWLRRQRSRVVQTAVARVHELERAALRLETADVLDLSELLRLRRRLAHVKHTLVTEITGAQRFEDPFLTELLGHIDAVRHALLEIAAHRQHLGLESPPAVAPRGGGEPAGQPRNGAADGATRGRTVAPVATVAAAAAGVAEAAR